MRLRHPDGTTVHLSYCTNVHPAEDLDGIVAQLSRFAEPVRRRLGAGRIGLGLWLAAPVVAALDTDPAAVRALRAELGRRGLEVVTLNAFPYTGFHAPTVKKAVYRPDWTEPERLAHTLACARVLTALLPADVGHGSVSTLPLAWREPSSPDRHDLLRRNLDRLAEGLAKIAADTGRAVRVGFEPEPGCLIETTGQAAGLLDAVDREWLGVCLDTCHLAVAFEEPGPALARLAEARLPVVKTQASCAVHVDRPTDPGARAALAAFAEQRFLHQTREAGADAVLAVDDLPEALDGSLPGEGPWRIHYHVPVQRDLPPPLRSTRPELAAALTELLGGATARTDHVEVETYTWPVLPGAPGGTALAEGIAGELAWTRDILTDLGLTLEDAP
ncbi:metabolite traffic protein EboE [Streptomyces sp. Y7]|uniref:metabolite traffic protein EboE n=1 Tax=Streptomyces sp. Y7 TaxID=3342392 RepID=UPI00371E4A1D